MSEKGFIDIMKSFYANDLKFGNFAIVMIVLSVVLMAIFINKNLIYGKNYTGGRAKLKVDVKDHIAIAAVNLPGPLIYIFLNVLFPNGDLMNFRSFIFVVHYFYRAFIYNFFRSQYSKPWPLESVIYLALCNLFEGMLIAHANIFTRSDPSLWVQILLGTLSISCAIVVGYYDFKICSLRTPGIGGYRVPEGTLFKYVSGPNYLFEIIQWLIFPFMYGRSTDTLAFLMWEVTNVSARAESSHAWYRKHFGAKYPQDRTPYIPGIMNSRKLI